MGGVIKKVDVTNLNPNVISAKDYSLSVSKDAKKESINSFAESFDTKNVLDNMSKNTNDFIEDSGENILNNAEIMVNDIVEGTDELIGTAGAFISNESKAMWSKITNWADDFKKWWDKDAIPVLSNVYKSYKDIEERTCATVGTTAVSLTEGVGEFLESVVDLGDIIGTAGLSVITVGYDAFQAIKGVVTGEEWKSLTESMWNDTKAFVAEEHIRGWYDSFYENTEVGKYLKDKSYAFDTVRSVGSGLGYTAGVVALTVLTCGVGGVAIGGGSGVIASASSLATPMALVAGTAGVAKGAESAWNDGAGIVEGLASGGLNGLWEGIQFYVGGKIGGFNPFETGSRVGTKALNSLARIVLDGVDGGAEGFVQPLITSIYKDSYINNDKEVKYENYFQRYVGEFEGNGGWSAVLTNAVIGLAGSAFGEGIDLVKSNGTKVRTKYESYEHPSSEAYSLSTDYDTSMMSSSIDDNISIQNSGSIDSQFDENFELDTSGSDSFYKATTGESDANAVSIEPLDFDEYPVPPTDSMLSDMGKSSDIKSPFDENFELDTFGSDTFYKATTGESDANAVSIEPLDFDEYSVPPTDSMPSDMGKSSDITTDTQKSQVIPLTDAQKDDTMKIHWEYFTTLNQLDSSSYDYNQKALMIPKKVEAQTKLLEIIHSKGLTMDEYVKQCGYTPNLSSQTQSIVDSCAHDIVKEAQSIEPDVSASMKALEGTGARLEGFSHRFKSEESVARKIASFIYDGASEADIYYYSGHVNDSLRYTLILDESEYSELVLAKLHQLISEGYEIDRINNAWGGSTYQGLNVVLLTPGDKAPVELQFHTESSFKVKEQFNHQYYEIQRSSVATPEEIALATEIMKYNQMICVEPVNDMVGKSPLQIKDEAYNWVPKKKNVSIDSSLEKSDSLVESQVQTPKKIEGIREYTDYGDYLTDTFDDRTSWRQNLTSEEEEQIWEYVGEDEYNSYKTLNGVLRGTCIDYDKQTITFYSTSGYGKVRTFDEWKQIYGETPFEFETRVRRNALLLDNAIRKRKISEPIRLYRGVDYNALPAGITKDSTASEVFSILSNLGYSDNGFMSASPVPDGGFYFKDVILVMDCDVGTAIGNFGDFNSGEMEVLLSAGQKFAVTDVKRKEGKLFVYLRTNN